MAGLSEQISELERDVRSLQMDLSQARYVVKELRAALKPFADHWMKMPEWMRKAAKEYDPHLDGKHVLLKDAKSFENAADALAKYQELVKES